MIQGVDWVRGPAGQPRQCLRFFTHSRGGKGGEGSWGGFKRNTKRKSKSKGMRRTMRNVHSYYSHYQDVTINFKLTKVANETSLHLRWSIVLEQNTALSTQEDRLLEKNGFVCL